ncbi:MATE family efflux transporter [Ruminococcaceae bacterium OttesenSCG-928-L11]|nr:MATE family efflux transporter [Ruminococcaceae bacterium OttesenSCG-928-L11]
MADRSSNNYDLTSGSILQKLLLVALPIMGTQLMQMTYNLTDMFWLGRVGSDAVAASGTAGMYMWLSGALMMIGRMGSEIGVSQSLGRSDTENARIYSQNAMLLAAGLGILYTVGMIAFRRPLVGFFNIQEANVRIDTENYLAIAALGIPFTYLSAVITGTFNGSGNSRTPFLANTAGLICNIILDPLMIFTLDMGIQGAALATILSQGVVCLLMIVALLKDKNRPFTEYRFFVRPSAPHCKQILRWSFPIAIESMLFTFLSMINSRFVAAFGANAMAVSRVGSQIESLSWLIGGGFGTALTAYVGQNFGAGKHDRIAQGFKISSIVMAIWGIMITLLLFFAGGALFSIFLPDPDLVKMGAVYLQFLAMCQLPMCLESVSAGAFKGAGRTLEPSIISVVSNGIRVPLCYFLSLTSMGLNGIWLGICLGAVLRGTWSYLWYILDARKKALPQEAAAQ